MDRDVPRFVNVNVNKVDYFTESYYFNLHDLCIATQKQSFEDVKKTLGDALAGLIPCYAANHLRADPEKTQICTFHLKKTSRTARTEGCMARETNCLLS